jgi:hypothetical protein
MYILIEKTFTMTTSVTGGRRSRSKSPAKPRKKTTRTKSPKRKSPKRKSPKKKTTKKKSSRKRRSRK